MAKLTPTQARALAKLTDQWQSAYDLQESLGTLNALVAKGYALSRHGMGSIAFPRTGILYARVIT